MVWRGDKKVEVCLGFRENWGGWGKKKATASVRGLAVALGNSILIYALAIPYACRTIPTNVFLECIEK